MNVIETRIHASQLDREVHLRHSWLEHEYGKTSLIFLFPSKEPYILIKDKPLVLYLFFKGQLGPKQLRDYNPRWRTHIETRNIHCGGVSVQHRLPWTKNMPKTLYLQVKRFYLLRDLIHAICAIKTTPFCYCADVVSVCMRNERTKILSHNRVSKLSFTDMVDLSTSTAKSPYFSIKRSHASC